MFFEWLGGYVTVCYFSLDLVSTRVSGRELGFDFFGVIFSNSHAYLSLLTVRRVVFCSSNFVNLQQLCIVPGKAAWIAYVVNYSLPDL